MQNFRLLAMMFVVGFLHQNTFAQAPKNRVKEHTLDEVTVIGEGKKASINAVSNTLGKENIAQASGKTLAALLEQVSGVSSIQTGTTIAKPVIHGMYGNRILMVNNGARLTGQQWGADHAPEIDKNSAQRIEVVKGAESVRYGSEALGGIILMEQKALPYGSELVHGNLNGMYGTNGRRYSFSGMAEGTMPKLSDLAWRVQSTYSNSGDQSTANYLLNNTGYREFNFSTTLGYRWNNLRLEAFYSLFDQKIGVMQSAQMGNEKLLAERIMMGRPVEISPFSRSIGYPHQKITHQTAILKLFYDNEKWGNFAWQTSYQYDNRRENRIRRMNNSDIPTVSLRLNSLQNSLQWYKNYGAWRTDAGVQLVNVENHSERGTGVVPIIPNYTEMTLGTFALQKYIQEKWGMEAGARFDYQHTDADGYDWTSKRYGGKHNFTNFTYSLGGHYAPTSRWKFTTNFGVAWRAPHVYELYSNGNELGSGMYVKGNDQLKSEQSYKWIVSIDYLGKLINFRIDSYLQWINNYIYDQPTGENITVIAGAFPIFAYKQTSAFFRGIDFDIHFKPISSVDYHFISALIWANERKTNHYLPYIPSARFTQSLTWKPQAKRNIKPWVSISHKFVAHQNRFDPKTDLIEFAPAAYNLYGFEVGMNCRLSDYQSLRLSIVGDNIFNKEYKEYTNRSRYYAHDMGRDIRFMAIWNF